MTGPDSSFEPITNLPELRGLLRFVHGVRHNQSERPEFISEVAHYRGALVQVEVALEGLIAALEEHRFEGMGEQ